MQTSRTIFALMLLAISSATLSAQPSSSTDCQNLQSLMADPAFIERVASANGLNSMRLSSLETPTRVSMATAYAKKTGVCAQESAPASNSTAMNYAQRYAETHGLQLVWDEARDYQLPSVPTTFKKTDLSKVLFEVSKMRGKGAPDDVLVAAAICQKTSLVVGTLGRVRQLVRRGCAPVTVD